MFPKILSCTLFFLEETATDYIAKDKSIWSKIPPSENRTGSRNILHQRAGPHTSTRNLTPLEVFKKFLSIEIITQIVRFTNQKAEKTYRAYNATHPAAEPLVWEKVTSTEIYSFIGLLITAGANNSSTDPVEEMWKSNSYPLYRATFSRSRFKSILRFIRFDDSNTRRQRLEVDKIAPISDIWKMMNENLYKFYKPTENLTIDEQLFPYRGRTRFTQYIPSKPAKYGIKIWWICDAETKFPLQGNIYTGKSGNIREKAQGERVVKELAVFYKNSGRNICMDNFFTTLPVTKFLLGWNLTVVGTLKKNKPYIPKAMAPSKTRELYSTVFGFHEKITICSYVPNKNKAVILLSSMHLDTATRGDEKKKPEIILHYNKNKSGVDTMDQMLTRYSTKRRTNRWPLTIFFNMLDISSLATYIIYYENNYMLKKRKFERRMFLRQLGEELARPSIEKRAANSKITRIFSTRLAIESVIGKLTCHQEILASRDASGRKRHQGCCYACGEQEIRKRRKTRKICQNCEKPVCNEHSVNVVKCLACQ